MIPLDEFLDDNLSFNIKPFTDMYDIFHTLHIWEEKFGSHLSGMSELN